MVAARKLDPSAGAAEASVPEMLVRHACDEWVAVSRLRTSGSKRAPALEGAAEKDLADDGGGAGDQRVWRAHIAGGAGAGLAGGGSHGGRHRPPLADGRVPMAESERRSRLVAAGGHRAALRGSRLRAPSTRPSLASSVRRAGAAVHSGRCGTPAAVLAVAVDVRRTAARDCAAG